MYRKNILKLSNSSDFWTSGICNPFRDFYISRAKRFTKSSFRSLFYAKCYIGIHFSCSLLVTFDTIEPKFFLFFFAISIKQREIICERGASGRKSNDLRNWIKPKRKLRNRTSSPYGKEREPIGTFLQACTHGVPTKSTIGSSPRPLLIVPLPLIDHRAAIHPDETQGRFAFGACPLTERVSHSIRNNALSAEALFRNDSCCPRMRALTASAIITFPLAEFSISISILQTSRSF